VVVEVVSATLGVLGLVAGALTLVYEWWGMPRLRKRVLVTFRDPAAPALDGILWQRRGRWLVLRDVSAIDGVKRPPTRLDGEVTIDRDAILFLQMSYEPPTRG
jgi:hypothetical protein